MGIDAQIKVMATCCRIKKNAVVAVRGAFVQMQSRLRADLHPLVAAPARTRMTQCATRSRNQLTMILRAWSSILTTSACVALDDRNGWCTTKSKLLASKKSWQRNWTHYHARGDANMWNDESVNHLAHIDGENPPTPLDEARKGNFNWEPHTDPNRPQADWTHDDMVEAHKDRGWNMAQGRDEAVELTSVHEWEVCQSVDNRPVPTGKYHPLAYAISAHKDNRQHCESFCEAMHDQTCYKACDSSGGCYCDGKFDLSINHCLTKMATKVCICSEEKHRDSGHEPGEKYNHSKIIHPRHHQEPAPPGRHDDRLKMKPKRGFRRKPSRRSQEEFEADRDGTHEQLAEKRAKRAQRRVERLRLHQEKIAAISAHHSAAAEEAQSRGQDQETLAQAARSAARLQNTQVHRTAEELVAQAKADFAYAMKVKQEL
eukprot:INCI19658.1.p1 GENE.INCI19658.1~~INCI19658.1.p1  ORF type:complete len:429 (-),score=47.94 INCI19658.1:100-1386(-)